MEISLPPTSALAVSARTLAGTSAAASMSGADGDQVELALGEPEPVGGEHRDRVAVELDDAPR